MSIEELYKLFLASDGVTTDTRKVAPGKIFFALKGERFNGNTFAAQAIDAGCSFSVIDEEEYHVEEGKTILVDNVLKTLQALAKHHRQQFKATVIGLTGSNGKTSSKELIRDVLASTYKTYATKGNLNNHIGVPLSLLEVTDEHEIAVIEMGANAQGEIRELSTFSDPDLGFITNMGKAHLEGFGGIMGVRKGKRELYDHLHAKGAKIFVNAADAILMEESEGMDRTLYGTEEHHPIVELTDASGFVSFQWRNQEYASTEIHTKLTGAYNIGNIAIAVAIGTHFNVATEKINGAIASYEPSNNRSEMRSTGKNTVIMDAYNANPTSVKHAIDSFAQLKASNKLCILGDMFELGEDSEKEHRAIMALTAELDLDTLFVGEMFAKASPPGVSIFHTTEVLLNALKENPIKGKTILLKGSRGMALERLMEIL